MLICFKTELIGSVILFVFCNDVHTCRKIWTIIILREIDWKRQKLQFHSVEMRQVLPLRFLRQIVANHFDGKTCKDRILHNFFIFASSEFGNKSHDNVNCVFEKLISRKYCSVEFREIYTPSFLAKIS